MEVFFSLSAFSSSEVLLPFLSFLGGKIGKSKANLLYVKSDFKSVPQANHANHSQTSPVEA